jgi:hypothetical protein
MTENLRSLDIGQSSPRMSAVADAPISSADGTRELTGEELALIAGGRGKFNWNENDLNHQMIANGIAGAGVGAGLGFLFGSEIPVVGNAAGWAVGGAAGFATGAATTGLNYAVQHVLDWWDS